MTGIIVGDVGGTNTRLGFLAGPHAPLAKIAHLQNAHFSRFDKCLQHYLDQIYEQGCSQIILAVAAPIDGDVVNLTNCDWQIDCARLRQSIGAKTVHLLDDLEALALALDRLPGTSLTHVTGPVAPHDSMARKLVIGAGTGFNAASLLQQPLQIVLAAECGHMTLPVQTAADLRLRDHLARGRGRVSVELALSGQGLCEVYHWVADERGVRPDALTAAQISSRAVQGTDPDCVKAAHIVLRLLAVVAGDLALATLPHGGIYLAGSVCRALFPLMAQADFADHFAAKGRQAGLMRSFPIHLITDDTAALIGCAALISRQSRTPAKAAE